MKIFVATDGINAGAGPTRMKPFLKLSECGHEVKLQENFSAVDLLWCDLFVLARPNTSAHAAAIKILKKFNKKIWVDVDDDMFNIPIDHAMFFFGQTKEYKEYMIECVQGADIFTVSNEPLFDFWKKFRDEIEIMNCTIDDDYLKKRFSVDFDAQKVIVWRGSPTHKKSLWEYSEQIVNVMNSFPDWKIVFVGEHPWQITERLKFGWFVDCNWTTVEDFHEKVIGYKPAIQIVVLADNAFSRARTNLAYLDATICGARVLAPNWKHWICPGATNYSSKDEFEKKLSAMILKHNDGRKEELEKARSYILKNHSTSNVHEQHKKLLEKLT